MARYSFTLELGALSVTLSPPSEFFRRSITNDSQLQLQGFSPNGTPRYSGPPASVVNRRYSWAFDYRCTEEESLIIEAIARSQSPTNLPTLTDEYDYIEPEVTPTKTFLGGSTILIDGTHTTGLIQASVFLLLPEEHKSWAGTNGCSNAIDVNYVDFSFQAFEVT